MSAAHEEYPRRAGSAFFDGTDRDAVDVTSALVVSRGEHHHNAPRVVNQHLEFLPRLRKPPKIAPKLTGVRFGRFTVVGMHGTIRGVWVVRCACGDYEVRTAKAIRNPNNFGDRCTLCRNAAFQKKDYEYRVHGREVDARTL